MIGDHESVLDRQSLPLYPRRDLSDEEDGGRFYEFMLEQDVAQGLLPIGGRIKTTDQACARALSGDKEVAHETEKLIAAALSHERDWFASAVAEFVNHTAAAVVEQGRALYEIAYYRQGVTPKGFTLLYLHPQFLSARRGVFVQKIPPGTRIPGETLHDRPREITESERVLDADRLLVMDWPSAYKKGLQVIRELRWLARRQYPEFLIPRAADPTASRVPFDFEQFREAQDRALASITRPLGWNARGLFDRMQTGYYYLARQLRFERFKIVLRDHIIARLNDALERVGRELGFDAKVSLEGLKTAADVDNAEDLLAAGKVSAKGILERFSLY